MRYYEDKSITKEVKKHLENMEKLLEDEAITANEMFLKHGYIAVIPHEAVIHWLNLFPSALKYHEAKANLTYSKLSDTERSRYEQQLLDLKHLETYMPNCNSMIQQEENPSMPILRLACKDLAELEQNELCVRASMFFSDIDFIKEVEKRQQINLVQYELSILGEENHLELLNDVDKAERLVEEESIIPLAAYCEVLNLARLLGAIRWLDETLAVCNTKKWKKKKSINDLKNFSTDFQQKLKNWTIKYPFLAGKPLHDMDRLLLEFFTKPPAEIIQMLGAEVVCFPYQVPEEMKNSPFDPSSN